MKIELLNYGTYNEKIRESWIHDRLAEVPAGSLLLDAGAGDQHHRKDCEHLQYVSHDFAQYDGKGNSAGLQTGSYDYGDLDIISDIISIPREDSTFDAILCTEVLEHVPNPELAIKELSRLLKNEGQLILTAPFCSLTHFAPYHFITGFNLYWYKTILPKYNLNILSIGAYGNYFEYLAQEIHRLPSIIQTYCQAPTMSEKEALAMSTFIEMLARYGQTGQASWQLLNYGFMILAEKGNKKE